MIWPLTDAARAFIETGYVELPFAVENRDPGQRLDATDLPCLFGLDQVQTESPEVAAYRASLLGAAQEYDTEILAGHKAGRLEVIRRVVRRSPPDEYGPNVRVEARDTVIEALKGDDGKPLLRRDGTPRTREKAIKREVFYGPLSAARRAFPDAMERHHRAAIGVLGGASPDKVFRLADH